MQAAECHDAELEWLEGSAQCSICRGNYTDRDDEDEPDDEKVRCLACRFTLKKANADRKDYQTFGTHIYTIVAQKVSQSGNVMSWKTCGQGPPVTSQQIAAYLITPCPAKVVFHFFSRGAT